MQEDFLNQLPEEVRQLISTGKCIAFIGSGLSNMYPSWSELVNTLCVNCKVPDRVSEVNDGEELVNAAQSALDSKPLIYYQSLAEIFGGSENTNRLYNVLMEIPFKGYITPNFDPLLADQTRNPARNGIVRKYPSLDPGELREGNVFYIHGLIEEGVTPKEGEIVLAKSEFDRAYVDNGPLVTLLNTACLYNPVCFFGCGLREPELRGVFDACLKGQEQISLASGHEPPPKYIFLSKLNMIATSEKGDEDIASAAAIQEEEFYTNYGIKIVRYDKVNDSHRGLREMVEPLSKLKDLNVKIGFEVRGDELC